MCRLPKTPLSVSGGLTHERSQWGQAIIWAISSPPPPPPPLTIFFITIKCVVSSRAARRCPQMCLHTYISTEFGMMRFPGTSESFFFFYVSLCQSVRTSHTLLPHELLRRVFPNIRLKYVLASGGKCGDLQKIWADFSPLSFRCSLRQHLVFSGTSFGRSLYQSSWSRQLNYWHVGIHQGRTGQ